MDDQLTIGKLIFKPLDIDTGIVAEPVRRFVSDSGVRELWTSPIDPALSDTSAFCTRYGVGLGISANCVVVEAKRAQEVWYAAVIVLATDKADINSSVRRMLGARKVSFASSENAVRLTGMEYGGITPLGLPADWQIIIDRRAAQSQYVVIGSGKRESKILIRGETLADIPEAVVGDVIKK